MVLYREALPPHSWWGVIWAIFEANPHFGRNRIANTIWLLGVFVAASTVRHVLVYDIKRFGRLDNDEAGFYRFQLRKAGVEVVYTSEGFNGDDTDDLLRPVKQWQARQESRELSKVTIQGLLYRSDEGWWSGGLPPYGYDLAYCALDGRFLMVVRYDDDLNRLLLDEDGNVTRVVPRGESLALSKRDRCRLVPSTPERVHVVRDIFAWYVTEGLDFKGIADRLNQQGMPSPRGGKWSSQHRSGWP